jgi:proteasome lid subunit RPN8/RPN11
MELLLPIPIYQIMLAYVQHALPLEACGLLAGADNLVSNVYLIDNIKRSPTAFEMDPQQQLEAMLHTEEKGLTLIAAFHSHPTGPQTPSQIDVAQAYYPELVQIIIALNDRENPSTRAFMIAEQEIAELDIRVIVD